MKACILFALGLVASAQALASEASVDRLTQRALDLGAHAERGAVEFRQSCSRCHGAVAQGDVAHAIPALAGQRFKVYRAAAMSTGCTAFVTNDRRIPAIRGIRVLQLGDYAP
jgi:cytochrome c553